MRTKTSLSPTRLAQAVLGGLLCISGNVWAQQPAGSEATAQGKVYPLNIASQSLPGALDSLAAQTGLQIVYPSGGLPAGLMSPRITGDLTLNAALRRILASTGLGYDFVNAKTISIRPLSAQDAGSADVQQQGAPNDLETIVVVGTNLTTFDPASPTLVLDSEQLQARGYSSLEDVLRALPQNLGSRTSAAASLGEREYGARFSPITPVGNSSINLRGMGSASTLILVNGKRRAGSAHEQGAFTDISSIPLSQVDYIEVLTDGASAVYGADAVAGVVNIVLKKNFTGTTVQLRREHSSNDAHASFANLGHTFGWGSGTLTLMAGVERTSPANLRRAIRTGPMGIGDFTADGGLNTRLRGFGSPGAVYETVSFIPGYPPALGPMLGYIPDNQTGKTLKPSDLLSPTAAVSRSIYETSRIGAELDRKSLRLEGTQNFGKSLELTFGVGYVRQRNNEVWRPTLSDFNILGGPGSPLRYTLVSAANPNNPFGQDVGVTYSYEKEFAGMRLDNRQSQTNVDAHAGLSGKLSWLGGWHFQTGVNYNSESGQTVQLSDAAGSFPIVNADGSLTVRPAVGNFFQQVNPFGNGSDPAIVAANRKLLEALTGYSQTEFSSQTLAWDGLLRGKLFEMPAGKAELAVGAQARREKSRYFFLEQRNGLIKSERDSQAVFAELGIPLLKDRSFAKELTLTLAGRYERFQQTGNSASVNRAYLIDPATYEPIDDLMRLGGFDLAAFGGGAVPGANQNLGAFVKVRRDFSHTSPLARLSWKISDQLRLRATWGQSFVAPRGPQLFGQLGATEAGGYLVVAGANLPAGFNQLVQITGPNPDLKPQVATTQTYGFDYTPNFARGLTLSMTYNQIAFKNYITAPDSGLISTAQIFDPKTPLPPGVLVKGQNGVMLWDARERNFVGRTSRSVDLYARYFLNSAFGDWRFDLNATRMLDLSVQVLPNAPARVISDSEFGPSKWVGDLQVGWERGALNATVGAHYSSGFRVLDPWSARPSVLNNDTPNLSPRRHAGGTMTFDAQVGYRPMSTTSWMRGMSVKLGAQNIFNRPLAFVDNMYGFLSSRSNVRGRVIYLDVKKEF